MGVVVKERHRERGGGGGELDHPVVRAERDTAVPAAQSFRSEAPARDTLEFVRENAGLREDHPSQRRWSPRSRPYCESTSTQSGFAPVQGTALYYEMAGDGPPVILMHPGQAGLVLWERQFLPFARSYRVIRYDARGFGRSERPDEVFSHYEDLRGLLDHLGIERASLVGLSLGGRTAIDFALTHPSRVTSLVLVNVGISGYKFTGLAEYFKAIKDAADRGDRETFVEVSLRQWFDGPGQPATRTAPALREEVKRLMREHTEQAARRDTRPRVQEVGAVERLGEIAAPTLIVESALDAPDAHAISALLERSIRGSRRVVVEDAAHLVNVERPDEFARVVLDFLNAVRDT